MLKWLESIQVLVLAILLFIGSVLWGLTEHWSFEPLIGSILGGMEIFFFTMKKFIPDDRPLVYFELKWMGIMREPPRFTSKSPMKGGYYLKLPSGKYSYTLIIKYELCIRNNSNINAHNLHIYHNDLPTKVEFFGKQNPLDPLVESSPITLLMRYTREFEMTLAEVEAIQKDKFPEEIRNIEFIATYQDQRRDSIYYTRFRPSKNNNLRPKKVDTSSMNLIKIHLPILGM